MLQHFISASIYVRKGKSKEIGKGKGRDRMRKRDGKGKGRAEEKKEKEKGNDMESGRIRRVKVFEKRKYEERESIMKGEG